MIDYPSRILSSGRLYRKRQWIFENPNAIALKGTPSLEINSPPPCYNPFARKTSTGVDTLKILLTNDDGIHAPGLWAAAQTLSRVGEVFVSAPDREQSGTGASLTLHRPVKARQVPASAYCPELAAESDRGLRHPVTAYAVEGTPGDSCLLALEQLVGKVDLVVSGINTGSNLGWDIMVSGTVGAALQGYVRGNPTIAVSVGTIVNPQFDVAARFLELAAARCAASPPDQPFFLNVNVPSVALSQVTGVQVTRLSGRSYGESVRSEGTGHQQRYWISRNRPVHADTGDGTDAWAVKNNRISITPIHLDLTRQDSITKTESFLSGIPNELLERGD